MTAPRPAAIEVLELRPVTNCGNVRAFVKLKVGGFVIHGVKVVRQENQNPWVALPQTQSKGKWFPVVEASKDLKPRIDSVVFDAWQGQRQEVIPPSRQQPQQPRGDAAYDANYGPAPALERGQPRDLPTRGGRRSHEPLEERAEAWSRRQALPQSGDRGQRDTNDPARPFDDEMEF
jgi:DNA-binding cell septation regulator SpoVG